MFANNTAWLPGMLLITTVDRGDLAAPQGTPDAGTLDRIRPEHSLNNVEACHDSCWLYYSVTKVPLGAVTQKVERLRVPTNVIAPKLA